MNRLILTLAALLTASPALAHPGLHMNPHGIALPVLALFITALSLLALFARR